MICNKHMDQIDCFWNIKKLNALPIKEQELVLRKINKFLELLKAEDRVIWAIEYLPKQLILSSSFGIQSSVSLHLITRYYFNIPVVLIDTGYLFPETYQFIDRLTDKMQLNLHIFRSNISTAWQESRYGKLWEQGLEGIRRYNLINKVKPMRYAFKKLGVNTWFAGLRRQQSCTRENLSILNIQNGVFKFLPIIDWDNRQIYQYMQQYGLEYHPLRDQGYISIGDVHTTKKWKPGMKEEEVRFFGLQRECGLHVMNNNK